MKERWYRADFEALIDGEIHYPDAEYYTAADDNEAIDIAKAFAVQGWDYTDVKHHVNGEVITVTLVDADNEFTDIKIIYE